MVCPKSSIFKIREKGIRPLCNGVKFQHKNHFGHRTLTKALITLKDGHVAGPILCLHSGRNWGGAPRTESPMSEGITPNPMSRLVPFA